MINQDMEDHYLGAQVLNCRSAIGQTFANHSYLDHKSFANVSLLQTSLVNRQQANNDMFSYPELDDAYDDKRAGSMSRNTLTGRGKLTKDERLTALRQSISQAKLSASIVEAAEPEFNRNESINNQEEP